MPDAACLGAPTGSLPATAGLPPSSSAGSQFHGPVSVTGNVSALLSLSGCEGPMNPPVRLWGWPLAVLGTVPSSFVSSAKGRSRGCLRPALAGSRCPWGRNKPQATQMQARTVGFVLLGLHTQTWWLFTHSLSDLP